MWNPSFSVKRTGSPVPTVPEMYKIYSIIRKLVYHFCKIVHHIRWIQRPGIILTLSLIMPTSYGDGKVQKMWPRCAQQPKYTLITTPTGSIPEARYLHYRHTAMVPTVSTLEALHCIRFHFVGLCQSFAFETSQTVLGLQLVKNRQLSYLTATASTVLALLSKPLILSCSAIS